LPYVYCSKTGKSNSENSNLPSMDTVLSQFLLFPFSKHIFPAPTISWDSTLKVSRMLSLQKFCMHLYPRAHVIAVSCISLSKQSYTVLAHCEALLVKTQIVHCNKTVPRRFLLIYIFNQCNPPVVTLWSFILRPNIACYLHVSHVNISANIR
jgi:hypothetical protein